MSVSIPVVLGTGREGRQSEKVARFVAQKISEKQGAEGFVVDVRDHLTSPFTIPAWVDHAGASKWRKIAQEAPGYVFVLPEYNRSFSGEFKLFFDSAFREYKGKPAILVGVSSGQYGGVRVIQQAAAVLLAAHIEVVGTTVATAHVEDLFEQSGEVVDEKYTGFVETAITKLLEKVT